MKRIGAAGTVAAGVIGTAASYGQVPLYTGMTADEMAAIESRHNAVVEGSEFKGLRSDYIVKAFPGGFWAYAGFPMDCEGPMHISAWARSCRWKTAAAPAAYTCSRQSKATRADPRPPRSTPP